VHEAGTVHRLDRRLDRLAMAGDPFGERAQGIGIRPHRKEVDRPALFVEDVHIELLARQVQSGVQHVSGLLVVGSLENPLSHQRGPLHGSHGVGRLSRLIAQPGSAIWSVVT
jgi:hypothetical protein